jgi:hypothetical protein
MPLEVFNEGKLELVDELLAEDFVEHAAPPGSQPIANPGLLTQ